MPLGGSHKQHFGIVAGFQFAGNRQRRDNMSAGAAACYENAHMDPQCNCNVHIMIWTIII